MPKDILARLEEMGDFQSKGLRELEGVQDELSLSLEEMSAALLKAEKAGEAITPETYKRLEALKKYNEQIKVLIKVKKKQEAVDKREIDNARKSTIAIKIAETKGKTTEKLQKREQELESILRRRRAEDERTIALGGKISKMRQKNTAALESEVKATRVVLDVRESQLEMEEKQEAINHQKIIGAKLTEVQGMSIAELSEREEKLTAILGKEEAENAKLIATGKTLSKARKSSVKNIEAEIKAVQLVRDEKEATKKAEKPERDRERIERNKALLAKLYGSSLEELRDQMKKVTVQLRNYERMEKEAEVTGSELDAGTKEKISNLRDLRANLDVVIDAEEGFRNQLENQASVLGIIRKSLKEGADEVDRFTESLGENAHGAIVAGAAMVYLANKISDIGSGIQDTAKSFAKYRVEATAAGKASFIAPGGLEQLEEMRSRLNLTTGQFTEYIDVLQRGANTGIISVGELVKATEQLQKAFGPDQAKRLGEYIDLLEMIPTLDTDLKVTASLDDQAAAWFALAEAGKVESVVDLQTAGLLGGVEVETERPQDVQLLESAQATEKFTEDVSQTLHSMFGAWGPKVILAATGILSVAAYTKATTALVGGSKEVLKRIADHPKSTPAQEETRKQQEITNAHLRYMSGQQIGNNKQLRQLSNSQKKSTDKLKAAINKQGKQQIGTFERFKRGFEKGKSGGAGVVRATARGLRGAAKGSKAFRAVAAVPGKVLGGMRGLAGTGVTKIGTSLSSLAETIPVVGSSLATFGTQLTAAATGPISGFTGAFSTAGATAVGTIGAIAGVVGAAVGPFVLIAKYGESAGDALSDFGDTLKDRGGMLGGLLTSVGGALESFGEFVSKTGTFWRGTFRGMGESIVGVSEAERKRRSELEKEIKEIRARTKEQEMLAHRQRSALELQRILKFIGSASQNAAKQLSDLSVNVAKLELENFELAGGSIDDFRKTVEKGIEGLGKGYAVQTRVFSIARKRIISNSKMEVEDRKAALMKLKQAELEAAQAFLSGMLGMIGQFDKMPQMIQMELQNRIREAMLDVKLEVGAGVEGEALADSVAILTNDFKKLIAISREMPNQFSNLDKTMQTFRNSLNLDTDLVETNLQNLAEEFKEMPKGEEFIKEFRKNVDFGKVFKVKDVEGLRTLQKSIHDEKDKIDEAIKEFDSGTELFSEFQKLTEQRKNQAQDQAKSQEALSEIEVEYGKKVKESMEAAASAQHWKETLLDVAEMGVLGAHHQALALASEAKERMGIVKSDKEKTKALELTGEEYQEQKELILKSKDLAKKTGDAQQDLLITDKILAEKRKDLLVYARKNYDSSLLEGKTDDEILELTKDKLKKSILDKNYKLRQRAALEEADDLISKSLQFNNNVNAREKKIAELTEERAKSLKSVLGGLQKITSLIERDPVIQQRQKQIDTLEKEYELQSFLGKGADELTHLQETRVKKIEAQRKAISQINKVLEQLSSGEIGVGVAIDTFSKEMEMAFDAAKHKIEILKKEKVPTEDVEQAIGVFREAQNTYFEKLKALKKEGASDTEIEEATKEFKENFVKARSSLVETIEKVEDMPEAKKAGIDFAALKSELVTTSTAAIALEQNAKNAKLEVKKLAASVELDAAKLFEFILTAISDIDASAPQRAKQATIDYAESLMDMATQEMDFVDVNKGLTKGLEALQEQFNDFQRQIDSKIDPQIQALGKELTAATALKDKDKIRDILFKIEILRGKKAEAVNAKIIKKREQEVALVKKATAARVGVLDMEQGLVEERISYVEEIGGTFANILDMQRESLSIEADKLNAYEKELEIIRKTTDDARAIREAEINVEKQRMALTKKALGAQRNAYEKLLGMAFGAINEARGGKRGITGRARMFGRGRVETEAGTVLPGSAGTAQTIESRSTKFLSAIEKKLGPARRFGGEGLLGAKGGKNEAIKQEKVINNYRNSQVKNTIEASEKSITASKTMEKVSREAARAPMQTAPEYGYGGLGKTGAGAPVPDIVTNAEVTVEGKVVVHFDNKMFADAVATLIEKNSKVKTAINTLVGAGFVGKV